MHSNSIIPLFSGQVLNRSKLLSLGLRKGDYLKVKWLLNYITRDCFSGLIDNHHLILYLAAELLINFSARCKVRICKKEDITGRLCATFFRKV